jgi:tRNA synthetases class I (W and Y)
MTPVISERESVEAALPDLARTTEEVVTLQELRQLLLSGRRLRMKYGVDLTAPELHLGHAVNLWLYRRLQELGHTVVLLLGDFTTQIGDPTGRSRTRPVLPRETIQRNADALPEQALRVLLDDDDVLEVRRNSEWNDRLSAKDLLSLLSSVTHRPAAVVRDVPSPTGAGRRCRRPRAGLPAAPGLRLLRAPGRPDHHRHRPALRRDDGALDPAAPRPAAAGRPDDHDHAGDRRPREAEQEPGRLHRHPALAA